ncbi:MAG: polyprenyl synthetase family protein [Proteobacteria bacterium]|nr:polyprenyl synthetase family protein [Pseudomonadota bacterium]
MSGRYADALAAVATDVDATIAALLDRPSGQADEVGKLWGAMRYASLAGGKRLRPFLVLSAAEICGGDRKVALRVAAAVEMMHTYSLVHDDLPAMDDDDLRRGQPTLHKKFDEATAILAGDALLTLAFEVLADPRTHADPAIRAELVLGLARAGGPDGMAGGQMLDLHAERQPVEDDAGIERLKAMKTGALFAWSCEAGAVAAGADDVARRHLREFGADFGLAFQITDDILDEIGDAAETGKAVGKDTARGKATFVSRHGLDGARAIAERHVRLAVENLDFFGEKADLLRAAAERLIDRRV